MAGFASESDSDYGYDLTASDEELLLAMVDRLSTHLPRPRPGVQGPRSPAGTLAENLSSSPSSSPDPDASLAIEETLAAVTDDDLTFDISELNYDVAADSPQGPEPAVGSVHHGAAENPNRRLSPSVSDRDSELSSFVSKTKKPRSMPTLLADPDVRYPDLSRALAEAQQAAESAEQAAVAPVKELPPGDRPPLLRFRTFPMKPLSVSDLTAGSWCELQYFYTLTRLPGGRKTRTTAMKRGSDVHEKLEREVFTPVQIQVAKREDSFGLKMWNIVQGLRVLRDQGFTREMEVWGMVDGNVVNGVIDGLSFENPDPELQEDVISSRGGSQTIAGSSQPSQSSTQRDYQVFITDVKTRNSASPPPQAQVRVAIIQLFLYHRFLSEMAAGRLDYIRVFERYGLNPDEPFSDSFMAQIGAIHDEVFPEADEEPAADGSTDSDFVSAPSSPSQVSFLPDSSQKPQATLRYRTLRSLLSLLNFELHLTFPRGAADLGQIVAVEYRYRGHDLPPPVAASGANTADQDPDRDHDLSASPSSSSNKGRSSGGGGSSRRKMRPRYEPGGVICVNTFFVEPEALDLYLAETMRWWKGEREPRGVALDEAFKCRSCEFYDECDWRRGLDREALRKARRKQREREKERQGNDEGAKDLGSGVAEVELGGEGEGEGEDRGEVEIEEGVKRRRGRRKREKAGAGASTSASTSTGASVYA